MKVLFYRELNKLSKDNGDLLKRLLKFSYSMFGVIHADI